MHLHFPSNHVARYYEIHPTHTQQADYNVTKQCRKSPKATQLSLETALQPSQGTQCAGHRFATCATEDRDVVQWVGRWGLQGLFLFRSSLQSS